MQSINFITSLLGLTRRNDTSDDALDTPNASQASCKGWSRPDPAVRLRLSENILRIFGFPQEPLPDALEIPLGNFGTTGYPPMLYLRANVPAYVSYIMGSDWRDKLRDDYQTDPRHMWRDGQVILRPSGEETIGDEKLAREEQGHCDRMLHCGAKAIRSEHETAPPRYVVALCDRPPKQLFGWPLGGGVWILRRSKLLSDISDPPASCLADTDEDEEKLDSNTRSRLAEVMYNELVVSRKEFADMDELCRALDDHGAEFYSAVEDCPEVVELGLVGFDHTRDSRQVPRNGEATRRSIASPANKKRNKELAPTAELAREEQAHCIRMLRCGARAILAEDTDLNEKTAGSGLDCPQQIFGWPSHGGVWILRHPGPGRLGRGSLGEYSDMDALCRALEEAGAEYYVKIEDCPEAVELGLDKM